MDELCSKFTHATRLNRYYDPTPYQLYMGTWGGVHTSHPLYKYTLVGELHGTPEYSLNITHGDYVILRDGLVLDVSTVSPRSILSWIRSMYDANKDGNCIIRMEVNEKTRETRYFVWTTERVDEGDELVYII